MPRRHAAQLASTALLLVASAETALCQIHSPQVTLHKKERADDLSWLLAYSRPEPHGEENQLVQDARFAALLHRSLTAPQSFWGTGKPLADAAMDFLGGPPGDVLVDENRYLSADACVRSFCPDRGLLWVDLGVPHPLLVFAAIDWISENKTTDQAAAAYSLWVFSNRPLEPTHLPAALRRRIERWTSQPSSGSTTLQNITRVFLVGPNGTPHTLAPSAIGAHNTLAPETTTETEVPS